MFMIVKISPLLIILSILACSQADLTYPIVKPSVQPSSLNQDYITDYAFNLPISSPVAANAFIQIEFPDLYQLPGECRAYMKTDYNPFKASLCYLHSDHIYLLHMDTIVPNNYQIVFEGIRNPAIDTLNSKFKIRIFMNNTLLIDHIEITNPIFFLPPPITSENSSIMNMGHTGVNQRTSYEITFMLEKSLASGDLIKFNFPEGYTFLEPTCIHKSSGTSILAKLLHNNRSIVCQGFQEDLAIKTTHNINILGVINPAYVGSFKGFYIETIEGDSANVYERINIPISIQTNPGKILLNIKSTSIFTSMNAMHQFEIRLENKIPVGGEVWIEVPPDFQYLARNCRVLTQHKSKSKINNTCELAMNMTGFTIKAPEGIEVNQTVTISAIMQNPSSAGKYKIQVSSYSPIHDAIIDDAFEYITISSAGSEEDLSPELQAPRFLRARSLTWDRKLTSTPGPLKFTFTLNIPLPPTVSSTYGQIVVDIKPQINLPALKTLACYFSATIPAQNCIWDDTTNSDRTTVIILTPASGSSWQNDVPITITTVDSFGNPYGIILPTLIQRYKFFFYFWKNGDSQEHEVYYTDYVPDPLEIVASDIVLIVAPLQYGQEAYLEVVWDNTYYALGSNYFFELEFDHSTPGWDYNLGWPSLDYYGRHVMPCIVVSLGPDYKCYMNPGGAVGVNSIIQIINISPIPLGTIVTIRLPKIKLGSSGAANLRFTVYENTPGENTLKIPIVYKDYSLTPASQTALSPTSALSITMDTDAPNVNAYTTLSFTSDLANPRFIIYEYPNTFTASTQTLPCSTNLCHFFSSENVNWIVFAITNFQGTSASTVFYIQNPPYTGTYTFFARTENNGPIGDYKKGTIAINPPALSVFLTDNSVNLEINKNSLLIFNVDTILTTPIQADGAITLQFGNLAIPDGDDFLCKVTGLNGLDNSVGVICEKADSDTIWIYNIDLIPGGTALNIILQLQTATSNLGFVIFGSFYDRSATKLVDTGTGAVNLAFQYDNFQSASIINDRSGDIVRANNYGALTLSLTPSYTYTSATMTFNFESDFSFSTTTDVPYCKLNNVRKRCSVSSYSPLAIDIPNLDSTVLTTNTPVTIFLTSDYSYPTVKGIKAPSTPGYKYVSITITDTSSGSPVVKETNGQYMYVYPTAVPSFTVAGTCTSADTYTMFQVRFSLTQNLNANTDSTTRGRIYIEFPTGTGNFRDDLGTGLSTGGVIGCKMTIPSATATTTCRLVKSPGNGFPAAVELVGFGAISAGVSIKVQIARVKNVQTTIGENVFGLRVEHVTVATGEIIPREYTTYNFWLRVYPLASTPTTYTAPTAVTFGSGSNPNIPGTNMIPTIYSNVALASANPTTDYYIYELPSDFLVSSISCPGAIASSICYSFPEIGWVVYEITGAASIAANTNIIGTISTVTMPSSFASNGYTFIAYIWKNTLLDHYMQHGIQTSYIRSTLVGTFSGANVLMSASQMIKGRTNVETVVSLTTYSKIPTTGTIEIRFQSGVVPLPNCKNSPSMGSALTSAANRVACTVQGNSWLITNFDAVNANQVVKIYGFVNLPSTAGTYYVQFYSYGNQDTTNIAATGRLIDTLTSGQSLTIQNYNSLNLDAGPSIWINDQITATANNYRPFIFNFILNGISLTLANSGVIEITMASSPTTFSGLLPPGGQLTCSFFNSATGEYIACQATLNLGINGDVIIYALYPKQTLVAGIQYRGTITSVFGTNGIDGIQQPSAASTYQVSMIASEAGVQQSDIDFYEIVPYKFTGLTVKNYVISPGDEDIISISFSVTNPFPVTDRIVIELPTVFNSTALFAEDLGLGLADFQDKLCETMSSTPTGVTMSCFFQKGNQVANTPATIVVYGFSASFTFIRFAFTAVNPTVTYPTIIPLTIYTVTGTTAPFIKTNYQYVERAVIVLPSASTRSNLNIPSYSTTVASSTSVTLTFTLGSSSSFTFNDVYVLKTPPMSSSLNPYSLTYTVGTVVVNYQVLPKNRFVFFKLAASGTSIPASSSLTISQLIHPDQGVVGSAGLTFKGYVAYFDMMSAERITFTSIPSDIMSKPFPSAISLLLWAADTHQNHLLVFSIPCYYAGILSLIISFPSGMIEPRDDCYEGVSNAVPILKCTADISNLMVYITLENQAYSATTLATLKVMVPVKNYIISSTGSPAMFTYRAYTTVETNPANTLGLRYKSSNGPSLSTVSYGSTIPAPIYLEAEYVPYIENRFYYPPSTYGDLRFKLTLPTAIMVGDYFNLNLISLLLMDSSTSLGDIFASPAVILYEPSDIPNGYIMLPATYTGGVLTFVSTVAISVGRTVLFRVTTMQKTGELIGIQVPGTYSILDFSILLEIYNSGYLGYVAQLGSLTLTKSQTYGVTLVPLTKAAGEVTAWEFTIASFSTTINIMSIEFPTVDDYGNPLFDPDLGVFSDKSVVPCASSGTLPSLTNPECFFFLGSTSQPAKILVRGFQASGTMVLYIAGAKNPGVGRRLYIDIKFYNGNTISSKSRAIGYLTEPSNIPAPNQFDTTLYYVDGNTNYISGTYTFRTPLTIPASSLIMVKLDAKCTGIQSGNQYFLSGVIGNYVIMKTTAASSGVYTFSNFLCTNSLGLVFVEYNMIASTSGSSNGERRDGYYVASDTTRQGYSSSLALSLNLARVSTNIYSESGTAKFNIGIGNLNTLFTFNGQSTISSGFVITITFQSYYFNSISACSVYSGLDTVNNVPVSCGASGVVVTISNFKSISSDILLELTYINRISFSGSGTLIFKIFGSASLVTVGDYAAYTTLTLPLDTTLPSPTTMITVSAPVFSNPVPLPGKSQSIVFNLAQITLLASLSTTGGESLLIGFERGIFTSSTTFTFTDITSSYTGCSIMIKGTGDYDYIVLPLSYPSTFTILPTVTITTTGTWPSDARFLYFQVIVASSSANLYKSNSLTVACIGPNITPTISLLHLATGLANEISISVTPNTPLSPSKMISCRYYQINVQASHLAQLDCICSSPAQCFNYIDGINTSIDIIPTSTVTATTPVQCYIPNILLTVTTSDQLYCQIMSTSNRAVWYFSGYTYYTASGPATSNLHTLTLGLPSPPIYAGQSISASAQVYSPIYSYPSGSYSYSDFGLGGPIYSCGSTPLIYCRSYNTVRNILVLRITGTQSAGTQFYLFNGAATLSPSVSTQNSNYNVLNYITSSQTVQSQYSTNLAAGNYNPQLTAVTLVVDELRLGLLATHKISFATMSSAIPANVNNVGGLIQITVDGVGNVPQVCYSSYSNIPIKCVLVYTGSTSITLTSTASIPSGKTIEVYFSGNNPVFGTTTVSLLGYSYYNPAQPASTITVLGSGTVTYPAYVDNYGAYVPIESVGLLSFITKTIVSGSSATAPIRVRFMLGTDLQAITGEAILALPANEYSSTSTSPLVGYFRSYTNEIDFVQNEASSIDISGSLSTGFIIVVSPSVTLTAGMPHELVILADLKPSTNNNFKLVSGDSKRLLAYFNNGGAVFARESIPLYLYRTASYLTMTGFQFTSTSNSDINTLVLSLIVNLIITPFPISVIEIEFPSASSTIINSGLSSSNRQLACCVLGLNTRLTSGQIAPRCTWVPSYIPKVRIENYAAETVGTTFVIVLYELLNNVIPKDSVNALDLVITYTDQNLRSRSRVKLTRAFTAASVAAAQVISLSSMTTSVPYYGEVSTLTQIIVWPAGADCTICRLVIRATGWDWQFQGRSDFQFGINGAVQNIYLDLANNAFVVISTTMPLAASTSYTFTFSGASFRNPLPPDAVNNNIFVMSISNPNQHLATFNMALPYPSLTIKPFTGTTDLCAAIDGRLTGANGGTVDCYLDIPISSSNPAPLTQVKIKFVTLSQYKEILPYCQAYVSSGSSSAPGGQLTCSQAAGGGTGSTLAVSGFNFVTSSRIRVLFRARLLTAALTAGIALQGYKNGVLYTLYSQANYNMGVSSVTSNSYNAPTLFKIQNFVPTPLPLGAISPFRMITNIDIDLTPTSSIVIIQNLPLYTTTPQCLLRSITNNYPLPIMVYCLYDATTSVFQLMPVSTVPAGRYMIFIANHQAVLTTDGVTFPSDTNRRSVTVYVYGPGSVIYSGDQNYYAMVANPFNTFKVNTQRNIVGSTSAQVSITLMPSSTTPTNPDTSSSEVILVLEFPTPLYDPDLGASTTTFSADGIAYYTGMRFPAIFDATLAGRATLHFGTSSYSAQVIFSQHSGFPTSAVTMSFPLIKNPAPNSPLRMNVYLLSYPSGQPYATVLYRASYTNYFYTVASAGETGGTSLVSLSNPFTQQLTSIILQNKYYGTVIDQNVKIYVKLKNSGRGFDFSVMNGYNVVCPGYTVELYVRAYMFYLTPNSNVGSAPTITCTGFKLGTTVETIIIETGCHQNNKYIYQSQQSFLTSALNPIPSSSSTVTRLTGLDNRISVGRYQITFDTSSFILKAGSSLIFIVSPGFALVPGLSEYIYVSGLSDATTASPPASIQAVISSGNLIVSGYNDYSGVITFTVFLKNLVAGHQIMTLQTLDQNQSLASTTALQDIGITTTGYSLAGSVTSFLTDAVDVLASEKFRISFQIVIKNALTFATNSNFAITGSAGFLATPIICKYRLSTSSPWVRSSLCTPSGTSVTVPIVDGFDISAGSTVYVLLTSEDASYLNTGVQRPTDSTIIHSFQIRSQISGGYVESVLLPLILYPNPTAVSFSVTWFTQGVGDDSLMGVQFTVPVGLTPDDFFQLDLITNDEISQVFLADLGTGTTEKRIAGNCAEFPYINVISSSNIKLECYIQPGLSSNGIPARIVVRNEKTIPASSTVSFYIAKIPNPATAIPGGYIFSVMTPCRQDDYGCPKYRSRAYTEFGNYSPKISSTTVRAIPDSSAEYLLDYSMTTFTFPLTSPVTISDAIVVKTNTANIVIIDVCTALGTGSCIHFPNIGWTFFQPSADISASSSASIQFMIENGQYYDRTNAQDLIIEPWSNHGIQQIIKSPHPAYLVQVPSAMMTYPTQTDLSAPYILTNFDNIMAIFIADIWRTENVKRIVVNTPSSYAVLDDYCMAGIALNDIGNTDYVEFPCKVTGDREITMMITDPSRWVNLRFYSVTVYFKGFLPAGSATGPTTTSAITSYTDVSLPYVLDEYTNYYFTVDSIPAANGNVCAPGDSCDLCYLNTQCTSELLSYCSTVKPRSCQPCQADSQCSHIAGKNKCLVNTKCVACLASSDCATGVSCINYVCTAPSSSLQLQLAYTSHPDTYLIKFPSELVANTDVIPGLTITLVNIDPALYTYTITKLSNTVFQVFFTVSQSIPITTLHVDFTHPTYIPSYYFAEIATRIIPYITQTERAASQTIATIGTTATVAMTVAAGSLLVIGSNPALFWALINLIQTFYYLVFINVDYPANVQFFLDIFTMATFSFVPNPMTWFDPNIDDKSLPVPAKFAEYDVDGLFLNNAGNVLLIWCLVLGLYMISALGNRYLRPSRLLRIFFAKMVGWFEWNGLLRTLMTSFPDMSQAAFLQVRVLTWSSSLYVCSSLVGLFFAIYGFIFPLLTFFGIKRLFTKKVKHIKKYKALTEEYSSEGIYPKFFASFFLLKWLIIMMSLVFLHDHPYAEIILLTLMSLAITLLLVKFKPYETKRDSHIRIIVEFLFFIIHILIGVLINDDYKNDFSDRKRLDIGWALISLGAIIIMIEFGVTVHEFIEAIKENWKLLRKVVDKEKAKKSIKRPKKSEIVSEKSQDPLDRSETMSENISVFESSSPEKNLFIKTQTPPAKTEISPEKQQNPLDISDVGSESMAINDSSFSENNLLTKKPSSTKLRLFKPRGILPEKLASALDVPDPGTENTLITDITYEKKSLFMRGQLPKLKNLERSRMLRRPSVKEEGFEKKLDS